MPTKNGDVPRERGRLVKANHLFCIYSDNKSSSQCPVHSHSFQCFVCQMALFFVCFICWSNCAIRMVTCICVTLCYRVNQFTVSLSQALTTPRGHSFISIDLVSKFVSVFLISFLSFTLLLRDIAEHSNNKKRQQQKRKAVDVLSSSAHLQRHCFGTTFMQCLMTVLPLNNGISSSSLTTPPTAFPMLIRAISPLSCTLSHLDRFQRLSLSIFRRRSAQWRKNSHCCYCSWPTDHNYQLANYLPEVTHYEKCTLVSILRRVLTTMGMEKRESKTTNMSHLSSLWQVEMHCVSAQFLHLHFSLSFS